MRTLDDREGDREPAYPARRFAEGETLIGRTAPAPGSIAEEPAGGLWARLMRYIWP